MEIVPAVLTGDPGEFEELVKAVADSGKFSRVQVDFIDGEYAANKSVTPLRMKLRWGQGVDKLYPGLKFDAQLMVVERNVRQWVGVARALGFDRIVPQVESISCPEDYDCLAMDFHSPVKVLEPYLPKLKYVLVMSVEPGFGGQEFVNAALADVKELVRLRRERRYNYLIGVDGGVEEIHLDFLEKHGVDEVAVGVRRVLEWT